MQTSRCTQVREVSEARQGEAGRRRMGEGLFFCLSAQASNPTQPSLRLRCRCRCKLRRKLAQAGGLTRIIYYLRYLGMVLYLGKLDI